MMQPAIKPIETIYNGYRFRSRLEARWAVFFDTLGIKYEYEAEGYDLGKLGWYLPDFWMPEFECFAEVKPRTFTLEEFSRCFALPYECLLLDGPPDVRFLATTRQDSLTLEKAYANYLSGDKFGSVLLEWSVYKGRLWRCYGEDIDSYDTSDTLHAVLAARQARFEHGEHGK